MSAAYRIDVEHTPNDAPTFGEWYAKVTRLSDEREMIGASRYGDTADDAVGKCRDWIALYEASLGGFSIYTDESGATVDPPSGFSERVFPYIDSQR